ncbi:MAG: VOC family protein [Acidimicrobiia bacterium]|nr:VOC family protein [Acidimicrobiia bacterium]
MHAAVPYLTFPGTCAEALAFYCDVFGAEVTIHQTMGESPLEVAPEAESLVFNAELRAGELVLKASDNPGLDGSAMPMSPISVFVTCETSAEQRRIFDALAAGGQTLFALEGGFGMVIDRFHVPWMLAGPPNVP